MIKKHKKSAVKLMRRSARVYLNELNDGKANKLTDFLRTCHDMTQYFVDLFWQRKDFTAILSALPTVHRGRDLFATTTRLAQALAKQAKETLRAGKANGFTRKPRLRKHTATLFSHFVELEKFDGKEFDYCLRFVGSGAPKGLIVPFHSTRVINRRLADGWILDKTVRLGRDGKRLWVDVILIKPRPQRKTVGTIVGMDNNYKAGLVFSDGQQIGQEVYEKIQTFAKRQKNTFKEVDALIGQALKRVDWSTIKTLAIEKLSKVKNGKRGTFSRQFNRRLAHWIYASIADRLRNICEENGIELLFKHPYKTSQFCRVCGKWDKRSRNSDKFLCVHCGHADHADQNAAKNLELLATLGVYGLWILKNQPLPSFAKN